MVVFHFLAFWAFIVVVDIVIVAFIVPTVGPVIHATVPVDGVERHPAVEAELELALRVLASHMVAVLVLHERGLAVGAVAHFLVLNSCSHFLEVDCAGVAFPFVVLSLAEFAEHRAAVGTDKLIIGAELAALSAVGAEEVQLVDDLISEFVKVVEVHPSFEFHLADGFVAVLDHTAEVFYASAAIVDFAPQVVLDARLAETMLAVAKINQIGETFQAAWTNLHPSKVLFVDPLVMLFYVRGHRLISVKRTNLLRYL